MVTYAESAVVRRSLFAPGVHKRGGWQRESQTAVGVTDLERRAGQRFPLGGEQLEVSLAGLCYAKDRDRPRFDAELHGDPVAGLAMVDPEAPQGRFAVAYGDVSWSVMAHQYEALVEVHGIELRERPARSQGVHYLHGNGVLEITFSRGRDAPRGKQGIAEYETRPETLVDAAVRALVVVGEGVEAEVFSEPVEAYGDAG